MSANALEMALWKICYDEKSAQEYKADPQAFLGCYRLAAAERADVINGDVRALLDRGVNDMLVYSFFQHSYGRREAPLYMRLVNAR